MNKVFQTELFAEDKPVCSDQHQYYSVLNAISEHKRRIMEFENQHLLEGVEREGILGMPKAKPVHVETVPKVFIPYNQVNSQKSNSVGVHFYIYDYLYNSVWVQLVRCLMRLMRFPLVISTDDSVFLDRPLIDNLRNVYKSRVFTVVGQRMGVNVVPTFSCGNPKDVDYYCDGLPDGGCIAVGGMGTNRNRSLRAIFKYCVREMCERKHPDKLLIYGSNVDLELDIPIVRIPTFVESLRNRTKKK